MSNAQIRMTNDDGMVKSQNKKYDLRERTAIFGEEILNFAKKIPENNISRPLINQLVRAGTSVGANYSEADDAFTKKDFFYKIGLCRKEAKESSHWLRMITTAVSSVRNDAGLLLDEARELNLIFPQL